MSRPRSTRRRGVLGVESFATTSAGYVELLGWLAGGDIDEVLAEGDLAVERERLFASIVSWCSSSCWPRCCAFWRLGSQSLWLDEWLTTRAISGSWSQLLRHVEQKGGIPPTYIDPDTYSHAWTRLAAAVGWPGVRLHAAVRGRAAWRAATSRQVVSLRLAPGAVGPGVAGPAAAGPRGAGPAAARPTAAGP